VTLAVALFGLSIAAVGVVGVVAPGRLLDLVARAQSWLGIGVIAAIRLLLGVVLLFAAPESHAPRYLQILGVVSLVSGAVTPFAGVRTFAGVLAWWRRRSPWAIRLWSAFIVCFGLSFVWAVTSIGRAG
jgi:membrane-bound ClpP family serine protease